MVNADHKARAAAFEEFKDQLAAFAASSLRNSYIYGHEIISVYVRKSQRYVARDCLVDVFDIASINIAEEHQNAGLGTKVIDHIHCHHDRAATMVESILNDQLYDRLIRQGWTYMQNTYPRCVIKYKRTLDA